MAKSTMSAASEKHLELKLTQVNYYQSSEENQWRIWNTKSPAVSGHLEQQPVSSTGRLVPPSTLQIGYEDSTSVVCLPLTMEVQLSWHRTQRKLYPEPPLQLCCKRNTLSP